MIEQAIQLAFDSFSACIGWFDRILSAIDGSGLLLSVIVVLFTVRFLVIPIIGQQVGSDKAQKKSHEGDRGDG